MRAVDRGSAGLPSLGRHRTALTTDGSGGSVSPTLYSAALLRRFAGGEYEAFLAAGGRPLRPRLARSLALARLRPGLELVDVGAGRGEAAAHAARRGADVTAIDISLDGLSMVRATAATLGGPIDVAAADAARMPIGSRSVDRVMLLDVIEHLPATEAASALREAKRILRPGGYVVIHTLPNRWALRCAYPLLRLTAPGLPEEPRSDYERQVHVNEQDPVQLRRALSNAGLESRVWVEDWSTRHAAASKRRDYPDAPRALGYPALRRRHVRWAAGLLMASPLRWLVGNDIFALAWRRGEPAPPEVRAARPVWALRNR